MRLWSFLLVVILSFFVAFGCGDKKKVMSLEDYAKIESELELPEPDIDPARASAVAEKYGYTFEQYKEFYEKVQKDPDLQEKLGELTLKKQKTQ